MQTIHIPRKLINQLLEQSQNSPAEEICGLIGARNGEPIHCYPIQNVAAAPDHYFQMDPGQQIDAMRTMREQNETLFAIYHSHPDAPAIPSPEDMQQAAYPDVLYLIISMSTTGTLQLRGFQLQPNNVKVVDIMVG